MAHTKYFHANFPPTLVGLFGVVATLPQLSELIYTHMWQKVDFAL
jgi:hypothetical protein